MPGRSPSELDADAIVSAAIEIFETQGLDAVSMRSVSALVGISPVPVYKRIGNKDALLNAMADRLLADVVPPAGSSEDWRSYSERWATALRDRLSRTPDLMRVGQRRGPWEEVSRPLIDALKGAGFARDAAVQACRLLLWSIIGFVVLETGRPASTEPRALRGRPGGDPAGVSSTEIDELFLLHIGYLLDGFERDSVS